MASVLNLTLNGPASLHRDAKVELLQQATGKKVEVTPYLDGSATVRGLADGAYTLRLLHPNFSFPVVTQDIRVLPDRPTIVPIVIPPNLLSFSAIEDVPDANLGPVQTQLDAAREVAARQASKKGGEPIYAADWNELADAVADVGTATGQLTRLVAPLGHDHPEIEKKIAEVDSNLQKFFEVFGRSVAELQRQIQQLALQRKVDDALDGARVPPSSPIRDKIRQQTDRLAAASQDPPAVYTRKVQEAARAIEAELSTLTAPPDDETAAALLRDAADTAGALTQIRTVISYGDEVESQSRVSKNAKLNFRTAAKG